MHLGIACGIFAFLPGCGPGINETRMIQAPAREKNCPLELITVDMTALSFAQQWDVLGMVSLVDRGAQDPAAEDNRALVRPRACAMGGTSIAVAATSTTSNSVGGTSGALTYMILRPKSSTPPPPQAF